MKKIIVVITFLIIGLDFSSAQVPTNGLVAYWPFIGNANDESGNGNHGTVNGAVLTTDRFGNDNSAYTFDGSDDFIMISPSASLDLDESLSISIWFLSTTDNLSGPRQLFWRGDAQYALDPYAISFSEGNLHFLRGSGFLNYPGSSLSLFNFHHVVGVYDHSSGFLSLYVDNILIEQQILVETITYPTTSFWNVIGAVDYGGNHHFKGVIDDVAVYNRALTKFEVSKLYNPVNPPIAQSQHNCGEGAVTLTASTPYQGIITWFDSPTDSISIATGNSLTTSYLTQTSTYYVAVDSAGVFSPRVEVQAIIHSLPANLTEATGTIPNLLDSLVAWYPFNGNPDDETGNGNNGTVIGNVVLTTDRYGNANSAYEFPGEAFNYISVPHSLSLELNTFTISAWIYTETDYGYGQVVQKNRDIIQGHYGLYVNGIGANVCYTCNNGAGFQENPVIGQWHMVTGTITGSDARFYLDGVFIVNDTLTYDYVYSGTDPMAIGMHYYEGVPDFWTYPYRGKIDDVLIYNRALSAEEVACLYNGECSSLILSASITENQFCKGGNTSIQLFNAQPGVKYQLFNGESEVGNYQLGNSDTLVFFINGLTKTSSFTVLATDTITGCSVMLDSTFVVDVYDVEAIALAEMASEYIPATVNVSSQSVGASTYEWFLDGVLFSGTPQAQLVIDSTGVHTIILQVNNGPPDYCTDADTLYLTTTERTEVILDIPSSFTPNADGINDYFEFFTEGIDGYTVWLKDTWGVLVYEYDKSTGKWDGLTTSGKEAPAGPYYYHIAASDFTGMALKRSGVVYLIRDLIELSPNPARDKLVVKMNGRLPGERTIRVMSIYGQVLSEISAAEEVFEIDVSRLASGTFFLHISNQKEILNVKFFKE